LLLLLGELRFVVIVTLVERVKVRGDCYSCWAS
jgi:hypothetical protein